MNIINNKNFYRVSGRTTYVGETLYLGFSGSFVEFYTDSDWMDVTIHTDEILEEEAFLARVAIFVNDEFKLLDTMIDKASKILRLELYNEYSSEGKKKVRIEKLSEAAFGLVGISAIEIEDSAFAEPTIPYERKIEFIGDSITCGYGVEALGPLQLFKTSEENPEKAFAIRAAKALKAEYQLVSWSGIGTITNWIPEDVNEPLNEILMPELYKYTDLRLCEKLGLEKEYWDNSRFEPDLIVINLGTNDDSYVRKIPEREKEFAATYLPFLEQVHKANPQSSILCILGIMGRNLCHVEEDCVAQFKAKHPEVHINYVWMVEQDPELDGQGADYHPSAATQKKAARVVVSEIKKFMKW